MRYLLATLLALFMASQSMADDFIVIVYDSSGSMDGRMSASTDGSKRMDVGKKALIEVLSKVPSSTKVGILTFDGWVYELGKTDRQKLTSAIQSIRSGGGTPLYEFVRAGATRLLEERERQNNIGTYKLVIVTDGEAGDDHLNRENKRRDGSTQIGVMDDIALRNLAVDAIGLDMGRDHPIKSIIASKGLGSYMSGDDPTSLTTSLSQAVAEVSFGDDDSAGSEAFAVLQDLPDEFFVISIKGLSTFQNHPIGEKPPVITVAADGTMIQTPAEGNEAIPEPASGGSGIGGIILMVFGGIVGIVLILIIIGSMGGRRY